MATDTHHNRLGRSLIEAAAIGRALHAGESTPILRQLNVHLARALEEYCNSRLLHAPEVEADVQVAVVKLFQWMKEMEAREKP